MAGGWARSLERVWAELRAGRHLEAYAIFALGLVLTILGLVGVADDRYLLSALLAVTFLVFRSAHAPAGRGSWRLDEVLRNRESFTPLSQMIRAATELWVYGPTALNVVNHAADIRQHVLARGGNVRVIVQDPASSSVGDVRAQLDDNVDFDHTLRGSLATLAKLRGSGGLEYRLLGFSPGFSLVVVDAHKPSGFLILECHGFKDDNISERMHVRISRLESLHWFDYWTARFRAMWDAAHEPEPTTTTG
jgi:hypothetical protein